VSLFEERKLNIKSLDLNCLIIFRFYFVGDEDLLEIIGNSKSIPKLQKHFKKMFAGITALLLRDEDATVAGIASKEAEEVRPLDQFYFLNDLIK